MMSVFELVYNGWGISSGKFIVKSFGGYYG